MGTNKRHNKPVGVSGSLTHETGPGVDNRTFNPHLVPKQKDLIEADVAAAFAECVMAATAGRLVKLTQLAENDLDYTWEHMGRKAKIELTELVLENPPYRNNSQSATIYYKPWSEKFVALVDKKNAKAYSDELPIDLLVYTTHFSYIGNSFCVDLAAERMRHFISGSNFDRVYYMHFAKGASDLYNLKPYRETLPANVRREYESMWHAPVNFANGTPVPGGICFEIKLG